MKKYKLFETDIKISKNTQEVIQKYIKDKKYIKNSNTLKISFDDQVEIATKLWDAYKETKDKKIQQALKELGYNK